MGILTQINTGANRNMVLHCFVVISHLYLGVQPLVKPRPELRVGVWTELMGVKKITHLNFIWSKQYKCLTSQLLHYYLPSNVAGRTVTSFPRCLLVRVVECLNKSSSSTSMLSGETRNTAVSVQAWTSCLTDYVKLKTSGDFKC